MPHVPAFSMAPRAKVSGAAVGGRDGYPTSPVDTRTACRSLRRGARACEPHANRALSRVAVRGRGVLTRGDCPGIRTLRELFQVAAGTRARAPARVVRAERGPTNMYSDIERGQGSEMERGQEQQTGDRLRRLPGDVQPPYDWLEFQQRAQIRATARESVI